MSFLQRAKEAAEGAAEQAKKVAGDAAEAAGQVTSQVTKTAADPATQEKLGKQAREAVGLARRGVTTVVERIDPGTLAEVIIKATALQEMTNASLRQKRSPYRISEVVISASIPPGVSFSIGRGDDLDERTARRGRVVRAARRGARRDAVRRSCRSMARSSTRPRSPPPGPNSRRTRVRRRTSTARCAAAGRRAPVRGSPREAGRAATRTPRRRPPRRRHPAQPLGPP